MHVRFTLFPAPALIAALFALTPNASPAQSAPCVAGTDVIVEPGDHPATVLQASGASCRVHYKDAAFPDGWTYTFNVKPAAPVGSTAPPAPSTRPVAANGLQLGRYNITVGSGASDGYLVLRSATSYELFLPGGKSGGTGSFSYEAASSQIHWISGPLTNATWDGTQKLEHDGNFAKIRIGKRTVASLKP